MFSSELKKEIADKVQKVLQETNHPELPKGEVNFLLHVDGEDYWSWANIRNNGISSDWMDIVPETLIKNMSKI